MSLARVSWIRQPETLSYKLYKKIQSNTELSQRLVSVLNNKILYMVTTKNLNTTIKHVCCVGLHCLSRGIVVAEQSIAYCPWMADFNLLVICKISEWQCDSVQWFVPREGPCLCHSCHQKLCYNCAWVQDTGICWIQGGVFSVGAQWNTFSASWVSWWTTAKGGPSIMMPGTIVALFSNPFPGNHTTCAIVQCALLPNHVAWL